MRYKLRWFMFITPLCLAVAGCVAGPTKSSGPSYIVGDLPTLTYRGVDRIVVGATEITRDTPLVVASLSDAQNLEKSSALGNIVADMIRTRLVQNGYTTTEIRLRNSVSLQKDEGEFLLSRNSHAIVPPKNVVAILTGTYTASEEKVYISLKLIGVVDAHIIAGVDFVIPYEEVAGLLPKPAT
jgi:TolB-like protein